LPAADFMMLPEVQPRAEFTIPEGTLYRLLHQTIFACSPDETRPILTGALILVGGGEIAVVATDIYRLAMRREKAEIEVEGETQVIVSRRVLSELLRILDEDGEDPVTVRLSERLVEFTRGNIKISSRLIEGEFPNYEKVIPEHHDKRLLVGVSELQKALTRAAIVAREDANRVVLHGEPELLTITATSPEVGSVEEEIALELEGDPIDIAFNAQYILEMLERAGSEQVVIGLTQALSPGTMRPAGREDYLYVLMPMQIMT
jgi:DNA polymerase-3 subunit beta